MMRREKWWIEIAGAAFVAFFLGGTAWAATEAEDLIEEAGVTGGVIVHLGCGSSDSPDLTADLGKDEAFLVHGLAHDEGAMQRARAAIVEKGIYGKVSVDLLRGASLPYAENLINLIVVDDPAAVSREELLRVLVPEGIALIRTGDSMERVVKPRPETMDEWTHHMHAPDNNPVAHDSEVGPPDSIQWMATPKFARAHEQQASFSACVSSGGKMFYVLDDAPRVDIRLPAEWVLIARDAFNGVQLWKRPMGEWVNQYRRFRAGPANLPFRLVAGDDKVFVTLDFTGPVHVIDAKSGETIRVLEGTERTKQIVYEKGILTLLVDEDVDRMDEIDDARRRGEFLKHRCRIVKIHVETGEVFWKQEIDELVFPVMALKNGRVFAQTPSRVFSLDYESGRERWNSDFKAELPVAEGKLKQGEMQWESPTLVVGEGIVYAADFKKVNAYGAESGELKWTGASTNEYNAPPDLLLIQDLLWMRGKSGRQGLDPISGEVVKEVEVSKPYMHPRCYKGKATDQFLMLGEMGVKMINLNDGDTRDNDWIRGTCQYGVMPANGLLYVPPDSCACNMKTKLSGLYAFASTGVRPPVKEEALLEKGAAFGSAVSNRQSAISSSDWPTFRGAPGRNGISESSVPRELEIAWSVSLTGPLSSPVVADGRAYVAAIDRHTVYALDVEDGAVQWEFTAGGRIDSPPTIYSGAVYFGSSDGWVYALRATDGELIWRFRAAPSDRRVVVQEQLESAWPVHGSVLIEDGVLFCAAGRSSYLDGGISLFRLDPTSGKVLSNANVYSPDPETGKQLIPEGDEKRDVAGVLNDILLGGGEGVFMRHAKLDFGTGDDSGTGTHLFSPLGFLDDTWWHRAYWVVHDEFTSHWSGWWKVGNQVASGRILSYDDDEIFGFGRDKYPGGNAGQWREGERYHLFAYDRGMEPAKEVIDRKGKKERKPAAPSLEYRWSKEVPLLATALAVTNDSVLIAGPPDEFSATGEGDELLNLVDAAKALAAWQGEEGGVLYAANTKTGEEVSRVKLSAPTVFDGMAVAKGRIYLSLQDGSIVCVGGSN